MARPAPVWSVLTGPPLRFLTSAWPWRSLGYLASAIPLGLLAMVAFVVVIFVGVLTAPLVVGFFILANMPVLGRWAGTVERRRLTLMGRVAGTPVPGAERWRELGYAALLAFILWVLDITVVLLAVGEILVLALSPVLTHYGGQVEIGFWQIATWREAVPFALIGTPLAFVVGAYALTALAAAQSALAQALLSPRPSELEARVAELRRSRLSLVDAFETERKRIERDLHDGVQLRLVALTMVLGQAEIEVPNALVRQAHREAEAALADLREAVRGIHPRVLSDLGLAAAVHEVADRMPIPVVVDITLDDRPAPQVEAAAYFVTSEGLANVVKHSGARNGTVRAWRQRDTLVLLVGDDGRGGASIEAGTGLSGLMTRLDALGGTLTVSSPDGGPTQLRMECPWFVDR
jgi:signal transduction histidine kinase